MIINADRVVFGDQNTTPQAVALRLAEGKIQEIGPLPQLIEKYPDDVVETYEGATILPGLVDMHTHIEDDGAPAYDNVNDFFWSIYAYSRLNRGLRLGVTTVRDVGSSCGLATMLNKAKAEGLIQIPRLLSSGVGICMTGGHGYAQRMAVERDGVDELRKEIRHQIKMGAQWIKILTSEGYRGEEYSQEELNAAVAEAHRFGIPASAHAGWEPSVRMCIEAGFDTIEHGTAMALADAELMKANHQTWIPTILAFSTLLSHLTAGGDYLNGAAVGYAGPALKKYEDNFKQLYDTGVRVACGTDMVLPGLPALPVAQEAECMVRYGITPLQAIEAATKNGADTLGLGDTIGQIKTGYVADLLVVAGNPAEDITALQRVQAVYQGGDLVK